jgi:diamine N-acetyltransferase
MSEDTATVTRESAVTLREITGDTLWPVLQLSKTLSEVQRTHVADNSVSIAQAHFEPHAWFRAIYADDTPVGFIMLYIGPEDEEPGNPTTWFLWRFMVGVAYQKMGFGRRALKFIFDMVREQGGKELLVSCHEGPDGPEGFYRRLGFTPNGKYYEGELGMVLPLA